MLESLKQSIIDAAAQCERLGLVKGSSGNVSARDPNSGLIAITPSGVPFSDLQPSRLTTIDISGRTIEGEPPSSETPMHTAIYQKRPDVLSIVHTHSIWATVFGAMNKEIPQVTVPLAAVGRVPIAPFRLPGSKELAYEVTAALGEKGRGVLLANHGVLSIGESVESALERAIHIEEGAQIAYLCLLLGTPNPIPSDLAQILFTQAQRDPVS